MLRRLSRERFLADHELECLMRAVRDRRHVRQPRDYALLALLANTGIRPSEALALSRDDIHATARPPWVRVRRLKRRNSCEPITRMPLHPKVAAVVAAYVKTLDPGAKLFPFCKRQSYRIFRYYARKAGIADTYRIFSLRHSVGMRLCRHTRDLRIMQAILGHAHLRSTASYVHVSPERLREAYAKMGTIQ